MRARHRHFNPVHAGATLALDARFVSASDGDALTDWNSRSGGSFNMSQATSTKRPAFKTNIIGGQPVVRFDGTTDGMTCSRIATNSNFTTILCVKGAGQNNKAVFCQRRNNADLGRTNFCNSVANSPFQKAYLFFNNGTSYLCTSTTDVFDNNAKLFCSESDGSGNSHVRVTNGAKEGTVTGQTWTPFNGSAAVGFNPDGGAGPGDTDFYNGDIAVVQFFPAQLSDAMRIRAHHAAAYSFKIACNYPP